jgi:GNAT superfamily N-acetyltransferase
MRATGGIEVRELEIPAAVGASGWAEFVTAIGIHYGNEALTYGTDELAQTPEEALPDFLDYENQPTRLFAVWDGSRMVGAARYEIEAGDSPTTAWLMVDVLPGARGAGAGRALSAKLEGVASTDSIRKGIVYAVSGYAAGPRIESPTGFGSVPRDNAEVRFLTKAGYRLQQVVRGSRLALPVNAADLLREGSAASGPDFRLHSWLDRTPGLWQGDLASLRQLMSTEEPSAGLEEPEDLWTVDRLVSDEELRSVSPRIRLTTAVEHVPSARLAGFTTLSVPRETDRAVSQEDTLVRPEHRGHRLGMLLKVANLEQLQLRFPGHPSVTTFNAEENRHMLEVNERLGFTAIGYEGAWRRDLPN